MNYYRRSEQGSIVIYIVALSTAAFVILAAILQQSSVIFTETRERYYMQVADQAAEAGTAYATSCLERNSHHQSWGDNYYGGGGANRPNLQPNTDCNGIVISGVSQYVLDTPSVRTSFVVAKLDSGSLDNSAIINATGTVEIKGNGGATVRSTSTNVKKNVVWDPSLVSEQSSSGTTRTCGVLTGDVYCWGTNAYGQLGIGYDSNGVAITTDSLVPVKVVRQSYPGGIGNYKVIDLAAGGFFNCVIIETNEIYCWGQNNTTGNNVGELGTGSFSPDISPVPVRIAMPSLASGEKPIKLGTSSTTACFITNVGNLYCWGRNLYGQLGIGQTGTSTNSNTPLLIAGPAKVAPYSPSTATGGDIGTKPVTAITNPGAFNDHMCAIAGGKAYCWGYNADGQLGINNTSTTSLPKAVSTGAGSDLTGTMTVTMIGGDGNVGDSHTCALAYTSSPSDTKAYCWGSNVKGYVGNGTTTTNYLAPKAVSTIGVLNGKYITDLGIADTGACVVAHPGNPNQSRVYCWGAALTRGDGLTGNTNVPVTVTDTYTPSVFANNKVTDVIGGAQRFCAIALGKTYCWGANAKGQVGDGTTTNRRQPTESLFLRPRTNQYIY